MSKANLLNKLYNEYSDVLKTSEVVYGDGDEDASLMLIGEAPGKDEVRQKKPFVGMAGKNLNEFLDILGIDRQSIYITNAIKYRLCKVNEKTERMVNRPATRNEILESSKYLLREINIIAPSIIVTLGNVPLKSVAGDFNVSIGSFHGNLASVKIEGVNYSLYPLYHPASIIYNRSLKSVYIDDIKKLKDVIQNLKNV